MKSELNIGDLKGKISASLPKVTKHLTFAAVIFILLVYIFTVWRISQLATAEPSADQENSPSAVTIKKVDQNAINQVLQLENDSPQIHSLFESARNNPFGE